MSYIVRTGKKEDSVQVFELIKELAVFEKAPNEVENDLATFTEDVFGKNAVAEFLVAQHSEGEIVGTSIFFTSYSTWKGRCLYLEDLIVSEQHRGKGLGKKLLEATARIAARRGVKRMQWQVLDWNSAAIEFYKRMGATLAPEWVNCKLEEDTILQYS